MRKGMMLILVLTCLASLTILAGCSRENAVRQLMADPQTSKLIMDKLWQMPETKAQMVQMVMNDPESMNKLRESLVADPSKAAQMLDLMLAREDLKVMITEKTAELHQKKK
ncbi:MAG: hypothetical protein WCE90_03260 [Candidatus Zixiibacteriota bacterium]